MSPRVEMVFRGWVQLTLAEKQEFQRECEHYIQAGIFERERLLEKAVLGPVRAGCICCGK